MTGADTVALQLFLHAQAVFVPSDESHQLDRAAQRPRVARHVAGAAHAKFLVIELHDRNRRFRRNSRHAPEDEVIEHQVAHNGDGHAGQPLDERAASCAIDGAERGFRN